MKSKIADYIINEKGSTKLKTRIEGKAIESFVSTKT